MTAALLALTPADLMALSSPLTVQRAQRHIAQGQQPQQIAAIGITDIQAVWSDATCTFPDGNLAAAHCTCPARRLCVHRVRTILHLQKDHTPPPPPQDWSPSSWSMAVWTQAVGEALINRALQALHDGLVVEQESNTTTLLPTLGIRVRFLPGHPPQAAVCSCGAASPCIHRVIAGLSWVDVPPAASPLSKADAALCERVFDRLSSLLTTGLDGAPPETAEGLRALSQALGTAFPSLSQDVLRMANTMTRYQARSAQAGGRDWVDTVGRLGARLLALQSGQCQHPTVRLKGHSRRDHLQADDVTLIGLGAEGFDGPRGVVLQCWFVVADTGQWVHVRTGRSHPSPDEPLSARMLWHLPMWEDIRPCDVAHHPVRLMGARISPDGALSTTRTIAQPLTMPYTPDQLPANVVFRSVAELARQWQRRAPPILRDPQKQWLPAILALDEQRPFLDVATFCETEQTLSVPIALHSKEGIMLQVPFSPATTQTIANLERWQRWSGRTHHLMVRYRPTVNGITAVPIATWQHGQPFPQSLAVGMPLTSTKRPAQSRSIVSAPPPSTDLPLQRLQELRTLLDGVAVEGMAQAHWRVSTLQSDAAGMAQLGLKDGEQHIQHLIQHMNRLHRRPDDQRREAARAFVHLLSWVTSVEEAWMVHRAVAPSTP